MGKEIELKVLDIDKKEVLSKLRKLGAKKTGIYNFKRIIFYVKITGRVQTWLRLRTDGKTTTLTLKEQFGSMLDQTNEYETTVKDFKTAAAILCKSFKKFLYEENYRIEYMWKGVQITVDKWPFLPWLVEIEGESKKKVMDTYKRLNIKGRPVGNIAANKAYALYGLDFVQIARRNNAKLARLLK